MRRRQNPEIRKQRIENKRKNRVFRGLKRTDRWNYIRERQIDLMQDGIDEQVAFLYAKREFRREQKHLKAFLRGDSEFKFGTIEDENGNIKPNIIKVL